MHSATRPTGWETTGVRKYGEDDITSAYSVNTDSIEVSTDGVDEKVEEIVREQLGTLEEEATMEKPPKASSSKLTVKGDKTPRPRSFPYSTNRKEEAKKTGKAAFDITEELEREKGIANAMEVETPEIAVASASEGISLSDFTILNIKLPPFPNQPNSDNCIRINLAETLTLLSKAWKIGQLTTIHQKATGRKRGFWIAMNGENAKPLPFSSNFGDLEKEGLIKTSDKIWFKPRDPKYYTGQKESETEMSDKDIHHSIHNPAIPKRFGSDEPFDNSESQQEKIKRKAEIKAFTGDKKVTMADIVAGRKQVAPKQLASSKLSDTECAISEDTRTRRQVPQTDMPNVLFWDLSEYKGDLEEIKQAALEDPSIGWSYRMQSQWLELAYDTIEERNIALAKQIAMPRGQTIQPVPPRQYSPQQVYIRMANVPILNVDLIREGLKEYWSSFGKVGSIEPHYIKGSDKKKIMR